MMRSLICLCFIILLSGCGPSKEKMFEASTQCEKYVSEKMQLVAPTKVFDVWEKNDALVVEVGYQKRPNVGDTFMTRKCVYDEKNGRISLPSILDRQWDKR